MESETMSMIPSAATLASILNDPAIPADAKPKDMEAYPRKERGVVVGYDFVVAVGWPAFKGEEFMVNAALFWSLSAWLWGRGIHVETWIAPVCSGCKVSTPQPNGCMGIRGECRLLHSPTEALAAVVREVAAQGLRVTHTIVPTPPEEVRRIVRECGA